MKREKLWLSTAELLHRKMVCEATFRCFITREPLVSGAKQVFHSKEIGLVTINK